jgi:hypothetical protein
MYSDEVQDPLHVKFIKKCWTASTDKGSKAVGKQPKTPEAIRKMHMLLDSDGQPRYSAQAIAKVLETLHRPMPRRVLFERQEQELASPAAAGFVTERRPVKPSHELSGETLIPAPQPFQQTPDSEPFCVGCPALAAATNGDGTVWVDEFSWSAITAHMHEISEALGETMILFYNPPKQVGFNAILTARAFQQTSRQGTFELRTAVPTPTKDRQRLQSPEVERQKGFGQRLSFDSTHTVSTVASFNQAQLKYEREVRKALTSDLERKFPAGITSSPLEEMLDSLLSIQRVWTTFLRDEDNADDGISSHKKLLWFIELCLTRLDGNAKAKWRQLSTAKQEASYYQTMDDFLKQLYETATPKTAFRKPSELIEGLSSSLSRESLDSWEGLLAKVATQVERAEILGRFAPGAEPAVLVNAELKFWNTVLTPQAKDALVERLYLQGVVAMAQSQQSKSLSRLSRFDLYPLDEVRTALHARAGRETPWDLDILWPGCTANGPAGKQAARGPTTAQAGSRRGPAAGAAVLSSTQDEPSMSGLSFVSSLDRTRVQFPVRFLKDEPSYSLRQKYEAEYLRHQVFPKAVCKSCGQPGHTMFVCPRLSKCNDDGVEQYHRSFFRGLHLPKLLQALPKGGTGKPAAAPVLMVAPSAPTLSALNLQEAFSTPEFQSALQTALQATRQQSGDLGNGRAGAGC